MTLRASEEHYRTQALLALAAHRQAGLAWSQVSAEDINAWNPRRLAEFIAVVQVTAARGADRYVSTALDEQGIDPQGSGRVNPLAFAGVAGDGRDLVALLDQPRIGALTAIRDGAPAADALAMAGSTLQLMAVTAVQDMGRAAVGASTTIRPAATGYVRMLQTPSCSRCVILAGKFYRHNVGFLRHPCCDCRHVPTREDVAGDLRTDPKAYFESLSPAEQDRIFTKSGAQAVRDGADMNQVVNARRGARGLTAPGRLTLDEQKMLRGGRNRARLERVDVYGRPVFVTSEGVTTRGIAGQRLREESGTVATGSYQRTQRLRNGKTVTQTVRVRSARTPRLMPESIYEIAENREDAIRLLRRFGYIV